MKKFLPLLLALCLLLSSTAVGEVLGEYPVTTEPITLTAWGILPTSATNTFNENTALLEMEKITGVHIEYESVTSNGSSEKRALMLSGDLPDIIFRGALSDTQLSELAISGQIIPLDDLVKEYAPNLCALFNRIENLETCMTAEDGHIYALGQVNPISITAHYVINQKWLDKLQLEVPTTLDEFYNVLTAFKQQDANNDGNADNEIPFSVSGLNNLYPLMSAFDIFPAASNGMYVYPGESEVKFAFIQDGYKAAMKYFAKLYKEGLLDAEFLAQDGSTLKTKGTANTVGVLRVNGAFQQVGNELHFDYQGMAPLEDSQGNRYTIAQTPSTGNQFVITANCKYPEAAIRWADYFYSQEGTNLAWMGVENVTWHWIDENTWDWMTPEGISTSEWRHNNAIQGGTGYPAAHPSLFPSDMWSKQNNAIECSLDTEQFRLPNTRCGVSVFPPVKISAETRETISFVMTDVIAYVQTMTADFITGLTDIDAAWDEYVQTIKDMGIDSMIELYQGIYDNYQASQK